MQCQSCELICLFPAYRFTHDNCKVDVLCTGSEGPLVGLGSGRSVVVSLEVHVAGIATNWSTTGGSSPLIYSSHQLS